MSRQSYKKLSKQVRISSDVHKYIKGLAVDQNTTIKQLLEGFIYEQTGYISKIES